MDFRNSLSYRCLKSVCLWSLFFVLVVIAVFIVGYILTVLITLISKDNNFGQGLGWLIIVFPSIIAAVISMILFAISNGYFAFILCLEYINKERNIPMDIVDKTEQIFDRIIKNDLAKKVVFVISALTFALNILIMLTTLYSIFIGLIAFVSFIMVKRIKKFKN